MRTREMPRIEFDKVEGLTEAEMQIARGIVATRGKNKGLLRASKPKVTRHLVGQNEYGLDVYEPDEDEGSTAYVWRMTAFFISPMPQHQCMPCTAEWDVPGYGDERRARVKELDRIVDAIIDSIKVSEWHGVKRWGQVFGVVGNAVQTPEGAIVYR